jgi:Adenylate and Guanylate cyclase catalytic domain
MSAIALEHGATIDKFIGDAIMLFFGNPETRGAREDAIACVKMAIAMQQHMRDLQAEWRERGQEHVFHLRIGINTGFCTVGNFGSDDRVDYTVIGNEVNLASRLQTHADLGGILIAHETYSLIKDAVLTEETGTITVKGFSKPVKTCRVVGLHDSSGTHGRITRHLWRKADTLVSPAPLAARVRSPPFGFLRTTGRFDQPVPESHRGWVGLRRDRINRIVAVGNAQAVFGQANQLSRQNIRSCDRHAPERNALPCHRGLHQRVCIGKASADDIAI